MIMAENAIRVIDIDGHVREADDLWERYLEPPFRSRAPKIQRVPNGQLLFLLEGNRHHRKPDESPFRVYGCQTANCCFCSKAIATTANPTSLRSGSSPTIHRSTSIATWP